MNKPALDALSRAKQRLTAHGWRQGARPQGIRPFQYGYNIKEAVVARGDTAPGEQAALDFLAEAARAIYPLKTGDYPQDLERDTFLKVWNDRPERTREHVFTTLNAAMGYANTAKEPAPEGDNNPAKVANNLPPAAKSDSQIATDIPTITNRPANPFDHDGDGIPGGSRKPEGDQDELKALRLAYRQAFGSRPFSGWDAETLREKLAQLPAAEPELAGEPSETAGQTSVPEAPASEPDPRHGELVAEAIALGYYEADASWSVAHLESAIATAKATDARLATMQVKPPKPLKLLDPKGLKIEEKAGNTRKSGLSGEN